MQESIEKTSNTSEKESRDQKAFNISVATGIIFTLIAVSVMLVSESMQLDLSLILVLATAVAALFSAWLSRRGQSEMGILLIISLLLITVVARVFLQKGFAIPVAITNIILISTITTYTLPAKWSGRVIITALIVSLATIIIDQYTTNIPLSASPQAGTTIALVLGGVYLLFLASQFSKFNLRSKLITGFLALSMAPLLVLGWQTYATSTEILEEQIKANLRESATSTGNNIERFIYEHVNQLTTEARLGSIVEYMLLPASAKNGAPQERQALNALRTFASKDKAILSYSLVDENGIVQLDTIRANLNVSYKEKPFFTEPFKSRSPYFSGVQFPRKYDVPIFYISVPVISSTKQVIGVLAVTYDASVLQTTLQTAVENRASGTEYTFLVDDTYFINLGHSFRPELLYKSYLEMDDVTLVNMQAQEILRQGSRESLLATQPDVVEAIRGMGLQRSFQAPSWENNGEMAESAAARVANSNWVVVASQPVSAISSLTQNQTRQTVTSSMLIMIVAAIIALIVSNLFTNPIIELTKVAEKISAGDFTKKANASARDEIGILGATFNKMTEEIQDLIGSLEKRVEDRTSEMEKATQQSEKRARELQIIADISRHISNEKDLEKLLPLITQLVSEQFGFYHVGIFLLNENKKFAMLRAANSPGGQVMLQRQHKLEVGQTGIVGNVTANGAPRIALDTGADAAYFNNPDLPDTHSEMALPLFVRGEIIGALDVQSIERNAFSNSDIFVLSLLADQIAIAIDNTRLIEETKKALAESQSVFREYLAEAWQSKSTTNVIGYYQTITGGNVITKKTLQETEAVAIGAEKKTLAVPIQLRGQTIGTLNVMLGKTREELTPDQENIVSSIAERLGLALENARLFEETSSRAARERTVSDITTKIRSTNNPEEMIKTAMEELKRALGASRVEVVPKKSVSQHDR